MSKRSVTIECTSDAVTKSTRLFIWQLKSRTKTSVLCPLLEDRGRITESIRILVPVDRMKQKCFQITTKRDCCNRRTRFVMIWKHFCFILSTGTRIRIDSVIRPRSSSRGRNTSASATVTVTTITITQLHNYIKFISGRGRGCILPSFSLLPVSLSFSRREVALQI